MPNRVMFIATARHPLVIMIMLAGVLAGVFGLVTGDSSRSIEALLPAWEMPWNALCVLGGLLCLSCLLFKQPASLAIERAGMTLLGTQLLVYATAVCVVDNVSVSTGGITLMCLGLGCLWRVWQITKDLKSLARLAEENSRGAD